MNISPSSAKHNRAQYVFSLLLLLAVLRIDATSVATPSTYEETHQFTLSNGAYATRVAAQPFTVPEGLSGKLQVEVIYSFNVSVCVNPLVPVVGDYFPIWDQVCVGNSTFYLGQLPPHNLTADASASAQQIAFAERRAAQWRSARATSSLVPQPQYVRTFELEPRSGLVFVSVALLEEEAVPETVATVTLRAAVCAQENSWGAPCTAAVPMNVNAAHEVTVKRGETLLYEYLLPPQHGDETLGQMLLEVSSLQADPAPAQDGYVEVNLRYGAPPTAQRFEERINATAYATPPTSKKQPLKWWQLLPGPPGRVSWFVTVHVDAQSPVQAATFSLSLNVTTCVNDTLYALVDPSPYYSGVGLCTVSDLTTLEVGSPDQTVRRQAAITDEFTYIELLPSKGQPLDVSVGRFVTDTTVQDETDMTVLDVYLGADFAPNSMNFLQAVSGQDVARVYVEDHTLASRWILGVSTKQKPSVLFTVWSGSACADNCTDAMHGTCMPPSLNATQPLYAPTCVCLSDYFGPGCETAPRNDIAQWIILGLAAGSLALAILIGSPLYYMWNKKKKASYVVA
eukprot:CAMPEP_0177652456 /NCGR_PEP_ID=MMETSP0447-20121125/13143_1 /TAXON_ID=0 /ORGANISM="Stygamoeba regulata, Strain BSH-02190019" /LENGTH=567 /DNA_ID=CAMNT_0019155709 /DNA_START=152 /DNA_END=1858 /DNA_ORIENTATION=+